MEELDIHVHSISEQLNRIEEKIDNRLNKVWLSIPDVIKMTGISRSSINRALKLQHLKSVKNSGRRMMKQEWVDQWLGG
jgi:predicted DNA-binding transcriptional regulator AlpA